MINIPTQDAMFAIMVLSGSMRTLRLMFIAVIHGKEYSWGSPCALSTLGMSDSVQITERIVTNTAYQPTLFFLILATRGTNSEPIKGIAQQNHAA